MVDAVLGGLPPGRERVAVMTLRVGLDFGHAVEFLDRAEQEAGSDELVRGRILDLRAYHTLMFHGQVEEARRLGAEALDIARRHHDDELEMLSSATLSTAALFAGAPEPELLERASELSRPGLRLGRWPDVERARQCLWNGELETAGRIFEGLHEMAVRSGIEFQRPYRLLDLALLEIACGNVEVAAALADDASSRRTTPATRRARCGCATRTGWRTPISATPIGPGWPSPSWLSGAGDTTSRRDW